MKSNSNFVFIKDHGHSMRYQCFDESEFKKCQDYFNKSTKKPKQKKPSIIYTFEFNNFKHVLIDRTRDIKNFTLMIIFPNKKKMMIDGVNNILNYLNEKPIPQQYKLVVEKHLMEYAI
jgi:hypothetical protein